MISSGIGTVYDMQDARHAQLLTLPSSAIADVAVAR
jgi:hypothetical protein